MKACQSARKTVRSNPASWRSIIFRAQTRWPTVRRPDGSKPMYAFGRLSRSRRARTSSGVRTSCVARSTRSTRPSRSMGVRGEGLVFRPPPGGPSGRRDPAAVGRRWSAYINAPRSARRGAVHHGSDSAELAPAPPRPTREAAAEDLARTLGIGPASAQLLVAAGYRSPDQVRALSDADLRLAGVDPGEIGRIRAGVEAQAPEPPPTPAPEPPTTARPSVSGEKIVERWLDSVKRTERPKRRKVPLPAKDSTDVLKK